MQYYPAFRFKGTLRKKGHPCSYKQAGVYFIKEDGLLVYIGMGKNCVVRACYRHFYKWVDSRPQGTVLRTTYFGSVKTYEIGIILTEKPAELEKEMIKFYAPRDNLQYLENYDRDQNLLDYINPNEYEEDFVPF